jgi:predicted ATPase
LECQWPRNRRAFPFSIPAFANLERVVFHPDVTFFVGENGSGKSTLMEAIACLAGFPPEGGSNNFTRPIDDAPNPFLASLKLVRGIARPQSAFFLRAESFFNVATKIDELGAGHNYGGASLHAQSHGESFLALVKNRFRAKGLYILDEPEAALSPQRQLAFLAAMHQLVQEKSQFIIATHSPILLAFPQAKILHFSSAGIDEIQYEETEHYALTLDFLKNRERYLKRLFAES